MAARELPSSQDNIAQRWRELAERRRRHIVDLYESGRWKHYYTEAELVAAMREAIRNVESWDTILKAGPAAQNEDPEAALKALQALVREDEDDAAPGKSEPDAA